MCPLALNHDHLGMKIHGAFRKGHDSLASDEIYMYISYVCTQYKPFLSFNARPHRARFRRLEFPRLDRELRGNFAPPPRATIPPVGRYEDLSVPIVIASCTRAKQRLPVRLRGLARATSRGHDRLPGMRTPLFHSSNNSTPPSRLPRGSPFGFATRVHAYAVRRHWRADSRFVGITRILSSAARCQVSEKRL